VRHTYIMRLLTAAVFVAIVAGVAGAEGLSIDRCMVRAMANNPDLRKAEENLKAAEERRFQALTIFLPSVSLNGLYTHLSENPPVIDLSALGRPGITLPRIAGNPLLQYAAQDNYSTNARISQSLFSGGRNFSAYRVADADYQAREAELRLIRDRVRVDVVRAFYGIIVAREMKNLAEDATDQLQKQLDRIGRFMRSGVATEYDYLKTEVQLLSWSPKVTRADRDLKNALRRLRLLLGESPDSDMTIDGVLAYEPFDLRVDPAESKRKALAGRPEIAMARAHRRTGVAGTGIKSAELLPQLTLQYNYNLLDQRQDFTFDREAWMNWWDLRLVVTWDIFGFGRSLSEIRESKRKTAQADIELSALEDEITAEVEDVFEQRLETAKAVELWKKNVELANRGFAIAKEKYSNGRMTNVDVLDSQVALIEARVQYLKALYDDKVVRAEFDRIAAENR